MSKSKVKAVTPSVTQNAVPSIAEMMVQMKAMQDLITSMGGSVIEQPTKPAKPAKVAKPVIAGIKAEMNKTNGSFIVYGSEAPAKLEALLAKKPYLFKGWKDAEIDGKTTKTHWFGFGQIQDVCKELGITYTVTFNS